MRKNLSGSTLLIQYVLWLKQLLQGNLESLCDWKTRGTSHSRTIACHIIAVHYVVDHDIVDYVSSWSLCGYKKDTWVDDSITIISFLGLSIPTFGLD